MRVLALIPAMILTPGGLLLYGLTAYYKKHWIGMFIGNCLFQGGAYMGYVITLSYTVTRPCFRVYLSGIGRLL